MRLHLFYSIVLLTITAASQASAQAPGNEALFAPPKAAAADKPSKAAAPQTKAEVVLFSAAWCSYCKVAKMYLAEKKIAYREIDMDKPGGKAALAQIDGQSVPILLANGYRVAGFTPQAYDKVFAGSK